MGDPGTYADPRSVTSASAAAPGPAPVAPRPRPPTILERVPDAPRARPDERLAPAPVRLLHAAAAADLDHRRAARPDDQPGRRRLARGPGRPRSSRRRSSAGCATSSATGPASFGLLTSGGVMANFMAMTLARDLHLRRAARARRPAPRARPRGRPGLHQRPDPLLDRAGARRARLPARDARRPPGRRARSASAPRPSRRRSPRPGRRPDAVRDLRGRGVHEHGLGRPDRASSPTSPRREGLWLHVDAAYGGAARLSARDAGRVPDLERADSVTRRPAQVVLPGLRHRRAARPRRRAPRAQTFGGRARVLPRRRDRRERRARGRRRHDADHDDHADQLNFYKLGFEGTRRWRALKLWMSWKHLGTDGLRAAHRGQRRPRRVPRAALRRGRRLRGAPRRRRSCRSSASGTCPVAGTRRSACRQPSSTPTRTGSSARSRPRATAG